MTGMKQYEHLTGLELEEAAERLLDEITPIGESVMLPLEKAYGAIAAQDIYAQAPVPAFPRSAMDGYAVRASDIRGACSGAPVRLKVIGEIFAGEYKALSYVPGSAVRVMTGAMIPDGYDAVIRQEDTDYGEIDVLIKKEVVPGTNYCRVGEELQKGRLVVPAGRRLGRIEVGLLAAIGVPEVSTVRPVKAAILSTGTELVRPGEALQMGKIYGSISYMLRAAIQSAGLCVVSEKFCGDDEETLCAALREGVQMADIVITTGGVSVGKRDLLHEVLDRTGARKLFYRANIQPGTPTVGSVLDGTVILSLSGNPYAALANFDYYFWYAAAKWMGSRSFLVEETEAELADAYEKVNQKRRFLRARMEGQKVYLPSPVHASSVISNLTDCNCYIDLGAGERVTPGSMVPVRMIKGI